MAYKRQYLGDFERSRAEHPDWKVVLSEGDSWFSFADVIGRLDDPQDLGDPKYQRPWCLLRLERAGDEVMTILSGAQRSKLRDYFSRWKIDALLFSGGGNDIIGPDLLPLLRPYHLGMAAQDLVAFSRFERRLRQIQDCYRELLDLLADAPQETTVFVNSYDYVVPSDRPVKLVGIVTVAGPWMLPYFDKRAIPPALQAEVVKILIDGFCAAIDQVAAESRGVGRLVRVETRGVVQNDWKDEIHPARKGSMRVAKTFEAALRNAGLVG
jgi:lysophospholipase L1-like esterase